MPGAPKSISPFVIGHSQDVESLCAGDATRLELRCLDRDPATELHRLSLKTGGLLPEEQNLLRASSGAHLVDQGPNLVLSISPKALAALAERSTLGRLLAQCTRASLRPNSAPWIMGIVNVTPDSFSDGGLWLDPAKAIQHGLQLVKEGANLLDIGGESTRPGAQAVSEADELQRVVAVIEGLAVRTKVPLSIDTTKTAVARAALDAGASWVNDISGGLQEDGMLPLVAERGAVFVAMHRQGNSATMQLDPAYGDCPQEVCEHLRERVGACLAAGIAPDKLILDPGIGFGKTLRHNLELMDRLRELRSLGAPILVGPSRKAFIQQLTEAAQGSDSKLSERLGGTAAAVSLCIDRGAQGFRVHDVRMMVEAAKIAHAITCPTTTA